MGRPKKVRTEEEVKTKKPRKPDTREKETNAWPVMTRLMPNEREKLYQLKKEMSKIMPRGATLSEVVVVALDLLEQTGVEVALFKIGRKR
jgi:hypothetical protein